MSWAPTQITSDLPRLHWICSEPLATLFLLTFFTAFAEAILWGSSLPKHPHKPPKSTPKSVQSHRRQPSPNKPQKQFRFWNHFEMFFNECQLIFITLFLCHPQGFPCVGSVYCQRIEKNTFLRARPSPPLKLWFQKVASPCVRPRCHLECVL